jgi:hypothetical protein
MGTTTPQESSAPRSGPFGDRAKNRLLVVTAPVVEAHGRPSTDLFAVLF